MSDVQSHSSLLEQFKAQHHSFLAQREQAQNNLNQLVGAIYACELMIKRFEDKITETCPGEPVDGDVNSEESEQITQD